MGLIKVNACEREGLRYTLVTSKIIRVQDIKEVTQFLDALDVSQLTMVDGNKFCVFHCLEEMAVALTQQTSYYTCKTDKGAL